MLPKQEWFQENPMKIKHAFAICALLGSLALSSAADSATTRKDYLSSAASACQLSLPTTDTKVRPRANGYRNEGTTNQFVICGLGGYEDGTVVGMDIFVSSMDEDVHSISCTGVSGIVGWGSGPQYSTKTVYAFPGYSTQDWHAGDFGGTEGSEIIGGLNLSVTCNVPPKVAILMLASSQNIDAAN